MMPLRWGPRGGQLHNESAIEQSHVKNGRIYFLPAHLPLTKKKYFILVSVVSLVLRVQLVLLYHTSSFPGFSLARLPLYLSLLLFPSEILMPHAHSDMMGQPIVNGEKTHSQFLDVRIYPPPTIDIYPRYRF